MDYVRQNGQSRLVDQPSLRPTRKVIGGAAIGIPAGILLIWVAETFILPFVGYHEPIPNDVAAAIGSILSFVASYFLREQETG